MRKARLLWGSLCLSWMGVLALSGFKSTPRAETTLPETTSFLSGERQAPHPSENIKEQQRIDSSISADGQVLYRASTTLQDLSAIHLEAIELSTNTRKLSYFVPSGFFRHAYFVNQNPESFFNQNPDTLLIVPQGSNPNEPANCHVYRLSPTRPPERISEAFHLNNPLEKPLFWQNHAVLVGKNPSGADALMFIQEGKATVFPLSSIEAFAEGIKSVQFEHVDNDSYMPVIKITLYNNKMFYISPFLTRADVPLIAEFSPSDDPYVPFLQAYYGNNLLLAVSIQENGLSRLFFIPVSQAHSLSKQPTSSYMPEGFQKLYHARRFEQDSSTQMVLGYTDVNPQNASVSGYIYDIQSKVSTPLPTFEHFELEEIHSLISSWSKHLIFKRKGKADALVLPFKARPFSGLASIASRWGAAGAKGAPEAESLSFEDALREIFPNMDSFIEKIKSKGSLILSISMLIVPWVLWRIFRRSAKPSHSETTPSEVRLRAMIENIAYTGAQFNACPEVVFTLSINYGGEKVTRRVRYLSSSAELPWEVGDRVRVSYEPNTRSMVVLEK
ncbi:MAG: DUF4131 domain-containing protein [Cystobacterineae bacterium]|nr:DUF4131 domain-containing protein [Cystobacterineae bacterium]